MKANCNTIKINTSDQQISRMNCGSVKTIHNYLIIQSVSNKHNNNQTTNPFKEKES